MASISIKSSSTVKPADPTWTGRMSLSEWDLTGSMCHMDTHYFYRLPPQNDPVLFVGRLKDSLSRTLVPFYPLAGRLEPIGRGRFELDCNAMGVQFVEAVAETTSLEELGGFGAGGSTSMSGCDNKDFQPLIPEVDPTRPIREWPLLLVQLTWFSCGSLSLCFYMSHAVADGLSGFHFLNEWARIARGEGIGTMPFLDRKVLRAGEPSLDGQSPRFDPVEFQCPPVLLTNENGSSSGTKVSILKLTKAKLEMLKETANEGKGLITTFHRRYTTYETLAAHTWRCACKARNLNPDQLTAVGISVDSRRRTKPPLPDAYFADAVVEVKAAGRSGDIVTNPLGYAAEKIREASAKVDDEYLRSAIDYLKNQPDLTKFQYFDKEPWFANPNLLLTSWLTLPMQGLDFGIGKEVYIGTTFDFDGETTFSRGQDGDGSVLVSICLSTDHIEAFEHYFYNDIV